MCGLAGFLSKSPDAPWVADEGLLARMGARLLHRGPDQDGRWSDPHAGIALVHRRLSIVDLSAAGDQPMASAGGRVVIAFNGEIYNHLDLRRALETEGRAPPWRGGSDTETLVAAIDAWGTPGALARCVGMFAFALWDRRDRALTLARDRLGEKPLYYGWYGQGDRATLLFASELKAMTAHPAFADEVDRGALALLLRHNAVPSPHSIYRRARKLKPGCYLTLSAADRDAEPRAYWSATDAVHAGRADPIDASPAEATDALERVLGDAVAGQMMADVPLGAFLSGGVDSSTIVALMQQRSSRPVKTFTLGFERGFDEATHAQVVARHLRTEHTELYVTAEEALRVVPSLADMYDEPLADSSQIPTSIVARLARGHVKVALSGDGGDELFAGYDRYRSADRTWRAMAAAPGFVREAVGAGLGAVPDAVWDAVGRAAAWVGPGRATGWATDGKLRRAGDLLASRSLDELYSGSRSRWPDPTGLVIGATELPTVFAGDAPDLRGLEGVERLMAIDLLTYLPEEILVKVDRAAMAASLETRAPLLDHRVVEFAWRVPMAYKRRDGRSKWLLRQVLERHLPAAMFERPKSGFSVPLAAWLRGSLRPWAEELLDERRLRDEGYLHPEPIRHAWSMHLSGAANLEHALWTVLMFQAWLDARRRDASLA